MAGLTACILLYQGAIHVSHNGRGLGAVCRPGSHGNTGNRDGISHREGDFQSYLYQGSHRLDKVFYHDFSLTISRFSMTVSFLDFVFATFCGKHQKMQTFYVDA